MDTTRHTIHYTYAYTISSGIILCHIVQPRAKLNADPRGQSNSLISLFLLCYSLYICAML